MPEELHEYALGELIRDRRDRLGITIEDLHMQTRIPMKYLVALEDNEPDQIPGSGYALGFLRTIARVLDLDFRLLSELYHNSFHHVSQPAFMMRAHERSDLLGDLKTWARIVGVLSVIWLIHFALWRFLVG